MKQKKKVTELQLFLPTYKATKLITESTQNFPKSFKNTLSDQLINKMVRCTELLVDRAYGEDIDEEFRKTISCVGILLRLCVDIKIMSVGRFAEITLILDEIKTLLNQNSENNPSLE